MSELGSGSDDRECRRALGRSGVYIERGLRPQDTVGFAQEVSAWLLVSWRDFHQ